MQIVTIFAFLTRAGTGVVLVPTTFHAIRKSVRAEATENQINRLQLSSKDR
jgi:hypothetical protein